MVNSSPWDDYHVIIAFQKICFPPGINPMDISAPWVDFLENISLQLVKHILRRINPMVFSVLKDNF